MVSHPNRSQKVLNQQLHKLRKTDEGMAGGEGKAAVPLLEKKTEVYFDGCPGCAMDRRKAENPGIPYDLFFHIWVINLVTCKCSFYSAFRAWFRLQLNLSHLVIM